MKNYNGHNKMLTVAAATAVVTMLLSGCGGTSDNAANTDESRGPITVWFSNNAQELAWGKAAVKAWNAEHPDEKVTAQEIPAASSSEEAITAAITAGTAPCLAYNISSAAVPGWVRQGGLVNLSDIDGGAEYIEARTGESASLYQTDGDYYQMPWKQNPIMVIYNKDIFRAAGIDPDNPDMGTYEKFLEGARKIVSSGAAESAIWPAPTNEFYQPWNDFYPLYLAETDGTLLIEDEEATFDSDAGIEVTQLFKTLYDEKLAPQEKSTDDAMATGKTAMQLAGPWAIASYKDTIDVGVMPVPTSNGKDEVTTYADAKNISMFTACPAQDTAWDFMKFTTSEEQDEAFIDATSQIPMRENASGVYEDFVAEHPEYAPYVDQATRTSDVPSLTNSTEVWQEFRKLWSSDVIFGKKSAAEFTAAAAEAVNELVKKG